MKNKTFDRNWLQFSAHWIYILLSLSLYQSAFPFINFISSYVFAFLVLRIGQRFISESYFNHSTLSILTVCNSVYLNLGYDYNHFYVLHIAIFLAMNSKFFFRDEKTKKGMFNPSMVGIFILAMLFPAYATHTPYLWSSEWWQVLIIFVVGTIITRLVGTYIISYCYLAGYVLFAFLFEWLGFSLFDTPMKMKFSLFWILGAFSFNKLIHTFHVITDPQSSPSTTKGRIYFGLSIAFIEMTLKILDTLNNVIIAYLLVAACYQLGKRYTITSNFKIQERLEPII